MRLLLSAIGLGLAASQALASERWIFDGKIAVTTEPEGGVFHHLDGAGRKHIAVSAGTVAVVWEDNRSRDPQIYVALKQNGDKRFSDESQVSSGSEAYEPSIASLPDSRFALAWEQDREIHLRTVNRNGLTATLRLSSAPASHVSLASAGTRVFAAWREHQASGWFVKVAALRLNADGQLDIESVSSVEADGLQSQVLFPSLALNEGGLCVAWEDRRAGHTRLLASHSSDHAESFGAVQNLNEYLSNRNQYDQGNGVTRVSLASFAKDEILAAWMDKRRGGFGYGIFASLGSDGGEIFGPNEKVHGAQGDQQPHYNPATAGNRAGDFVVAWDDFRSGDSDIWFSIYNEDDEWGEDFNPAPASGAGEQSHPAITLDSQGGVHLLWMERRDMDAPSQLWYSHGSTR